ncbi:MAG: NUDIX domain-containing protein [Anaerolineaceae bacterium]|nr:NUDIX domain-containing protein [Anaerolineaceae bacterium]
MTTVFLEQREREQCPECGWIFYPHLKVGAGALIERNGAVLLVRRAIEPWKGMWYLPAGYVEADETPKAAAERETREETGLIIKARNLQDVYYFEDDPRGNGLLILFSAEICGGVLSCTAEASACSYFLPAELPAEIAGQAHQRALADWVDRKKHGL